MKRETYTELPRVLKWMKGKIGSFKMLLLTMELDPFQGVLKIQVRIIIM